MTETQTQEATPVASSVSPSGIEIEFWLEPKRHYRLRWAEGAEHLTAERDPENNPGQMVPVGPRPYQGMHDWQIVPSVTEVLGVLDKPALPWWGMKVGIEGVIAMHNMGLLKSLPMEHQNVLAYEGEMNVWHAAGVQQVVDLLGKHSLTVNHVRDKAGERGVSVHDALEAWATTGMVPDPSMYPPNEQGYVVGLVNFLNDSRIIPVATEVLVGSVTHGFAGRYDLDATACDEDRQVVFHRTPVKGPQYKTLKADSKLTLDLKTSSGVYPSHAMQLEAYEIARVECGLEPSDARGILHVSAEGEYEFVRSWAIADDFLAVLGVWQAQEAMKIRKKESK